MRSPVALHVRVTDSVSLLEELLPRLEDELPEKKKNPHGGNGSGKGGHPPLTSWNTQAAMLVMDIHAGVRELETDLRYSVTGVVRSRGGSDGNTLRSLRGLPALCAGCDYAAVQLACKKMESWIWRARMVLGDAEPFSRLPRLPGQGEPACPFCKTAGSLRVRHATGMVICLKPTCRDSEGSRPQGRIEVGSFSGEPLVAWASGETGIGVVSGAA
jgi:hypothetical protein